MMRCDGPRCLRVPFAGACGRLSSLWGGDREPGPGGGHRAMRAAGLALCSWDPLPPASAAPREGRSEVGGALRRGLSETPFCTWTWEQDASASVRPPTWLRGPFRREL